jgi:hypothetical protein
MEETDEAALADPPAYDDLEVAASFDPPHAPANMASPAEAVIASARRCASGNSGRGQRRTRLLSFTARPASQPFLC